VKQIIAGYFDALEKCLREIQVTDQKGQVLVAEDGIERAAVLIETQTSAGHKIIFVGNGASAAISSHHKPSGNRLLEKWRDASHSV